LADHTTCALAGYVPEPGGIGLRLNRDVPVDWRNVSPLARGNCTSTAEPHGQGTWGIIDLRGKGGRIRTVAVPIWVKQGIEAWTAAAKIDKGRLLLPLSKSGKIVGDELGDWAIWSVVEQSSKQIGIEHFGAHDLRRTCPKLCRKNGGDLEQINSCSATLRSRQPNAISARRQDIEIAVNDNLGL